MAPAEVGCVNTKAEKQHLNWLVLLGASERKDLQRDVSLPRDLMVCSVYIFK